LSHQKSQFENWLLYFFNPIDNSTGYFVVDAGKECEHTKQDDICRN